MNAVVSAGLQFPKSASYSFILIGIIVPKRVAQTRDAWGSLRIEGAGLSKPYITQFVERYAIYLIQEEKTALPGAVG